MSTPSARNDASLSSAMTRTSMSGCSRPKSARRGISHFDANDGVVLTASTVGRSPRASVASEMICSARWTDEKYSSPSRVSASPLGKRRNS